MSRFTAGLVVGWVVFLVQDVVVQWLQPGTVSLATMILTWMGAAHA